MLAAAQGQRRDNLTEDEVKEIRALYLEITEAPTLSKLSLDDLMEQLKPETLFERFAARKAN